MRKFLAEKFRQILIVAFQINVKFIYPPFALIICSLKCDDVECVEVANFIYIGHQADAGLVEGPVDLHVVGAVAGQAVELVDDDVVNVTGVLEVAEHPLQLRAVGAAGGLAAIDLFQAEVTAESRPCSARVREDDEEQKGLPIGKEKHIANIVVS